MKIYTDKDYKEDWRTKANFKLLKWGNYLMHNPDLIMKIIVPFLIFSIVAFGYLTYIFSIYALNGESIRWIFAAFTAFIVYTLCKSLWNIYSFKRKGIRLDIIEDLTVDKAVRSYANLWGLGKKK